ncbi:MAG TPA: lipoprotein [Bdellovibrionales bacterium]|nr:lipoprotein [Bdellovibrionales bacterium]
MKQILFVIFSIAMLSACTFSGGKASLSGAPAADSRPPAYSSFQIGRKAIQLLPYPMRMSKLRHVVRSDNPDFFRAIEERKNELGAFDHSRGIGQELSWLETRMELWTKAVQPICGSSHMFELYSWRGGLTQLVLNAYGRELSSADEDIINRIDGMNITPQAKFEIYCLSVLSSLEFLTL